MTMQPISAHQSPPAAPREYSTPVAQSAPQDTYTSEAPSQAVTSGTSLIPRPDEVHPEAPVVYRPKTKVGCSAAVIAAVGGATALVAAPAVLPVATGVVLGAAVGTGLGWIWTVLSGRRLTNRYEQDLLEEALRGYDASRQSWAAHARVLRKIEELPPFSYKAGDKERESARVRGHLMAALHRELVHIGIAEPVTVLAKEVAALLTSPMDMRTPTYALRVDNVCERLGDATDATKALRHNVLMMSDPERRTPYQVREAELGNLLYGRQASPYTCKNIAWKLALALGEAGINLAVGLAGANMSGIFAAKRAADTRQMATAMAGAQVAPQAVSNAKAAFKDEEMRRDRLRAVHYAVQDMSKSEVEALPEPWRRGVLDTDRKISHAIGHNLESANTLLERRQLVYLSCPVHTKQLMATGRSDEGHRDICAAIDHKVGALMRDYADFKDLSSMIERIRVNSLAETPSRRAQYYLYGESGVGKTRFAERLAKALDLPIVKVNLNDSETLKSLTGSFMGLKGNALFSPDTNPMALVGVLQHAILQSGVRNPIIFFDEAGELLQQVGRSADAGRGFMMFGGTKQDDLAAAAAKLKTIFDPANSKRLPVEALGTDLDLDFMHPTLIFAGNYEISNDALSKRIETIKFPNLTPEKKEEIACSEVERCLNPYKNTLSVEQSKGALVDVRGLLPLIAQFEQKASNPGAHRLVAAAAELAAYVVAQKLSNKPVEVAAAAAKMEGTYRTDLEDAVARAQAASASSPPSAAAFSGRPGAAGLTDELLRGFGR